MSDLIKQDKLQEQEQEKLSMQVLIDSKSLPANIVNVETAFTVAQFGKELGFQPMQSFHYLISINGRLSLNAKGQSALCRKHGIRYRTIKDSYYVYIDEKGGSIETEYKIPGKSFNDRVTEIEFTRIYPDHTQIETVKYLLSEAMKAELTGKDVWKKYERDMLYSRCLTRGLNRIASDIMGGLYTTDEVFGFSNIDESRVKRDKDNNIEDIQDIAYEEQ